MEWRALLQSLNVVADPSYAEADLEQNELIPFLSDTRIGSVPLYISGDGWFMYSIAVPLGALPSDFSGVETFSVQPDPSFGWWQSGLDELKPENVGMSFPGESFSPAYLKQGTPMTKLRYYRFNERNPYIELPQDLTDVLQLHRDDETGNFCRVDRRGDKEAVCNIQIKPRIVVAINAPALYAYLHFKNCALVRLFNVIRSKGKILGGWSHFERVDRSAPELNIFAYFQDNPSPTDEDRMSMMRGAQIIGLDRNQVWEMAKQELTEEADDRYCDFITQDWKNERVALCSCAPSDTSNYFEPPNDKPFETSPVFFRPEVLDKYKNDPDNYEVESRHIYKIEGWYLTTYDVNAEGQVHTYLGYLSDLPYEEQLHWKAHNEPPKGTISARAVETDFAGEWSEIRYPDEVVKEALGRVLTELPELLKNVDDSSISQLHRVHTDNRKQWEDSLLHLHQLVVEPLNLSEIRAIAAELGCLDKTLKSLRQLDEVVEKLGYSRDEVAVLSELNYLRNKVVGHRRGSEALEVTRRVRKVHGSFPAHFDDLLSRVTAAMEFFLSQKDALRSGH